MDPHACIDLGRRRDSARSSSVQGRFVCQPYFSCLGRSRPDSRHHDLVDLFQQTLLLEKVSYMIKDSKQLVFVNLNV